ncbi:MAG: T9SS type A sorting domain-containing protein [Bacteroidota bacterium]
MRTIKVLLSVAFIFWTAVVHAQTTVNAADYGLNWHLEASASGIVDEYDLVVTLGDPGASIAGLLSFTINLKFDPGIALPGSGALGLASSWALAGGGTADVGADAAQHAVSVVATGLGGVSGRGEVFRLTLNLVGVLPDPSQIVEEGTGIMIIEDLGFRQMAPAPAAPALPFSIYPNPTAGHVQVQGAETLDHLQVFNAAGERCWARTVNGAVQVTIDLSNFSPGVYLLAARYKDGRVARERILRR